MSNLKVAALQLGFYAGLFRLVQLTARYQARILTFHRFSGNGEGHTRGLPVQKFAEYMEYLTRHYRVVSLGDLVAELQRGELQPYTTAVTIDDGYHEVFSLIAPVLRRYRIPASFFVVSEFADGRLWLWTDQFRFVFEHAPRGRVAFRYNGSIYNVEMQTEGDRRRSEKQWREYAKRLPQVERQELLLTIAEAWEIKIPATPPREFQPMTWGQLQTLAAEGFDVGGHTRTHPILSHVDFAQLQDEIVGCKEQIERNIGIPVRHFAYPNGYREDYTLVAVEAVVRAGYQAAVTTELPHHTTSVSLFELPRLDAAVEDLPHFAQTVSGFERAKLETRAQFKRMSDRLRVFSRSRPAKGG